MPELPEVETMRRGILGIVGSRICRVTRSRCRLRPIEIAPSLATIRRRIVDRCILAVSRAGKRVVLEIEGDERLVFEPRMTGLVLLADPPNADHLRWKMEFADGPHPHLWYWDRRGLGSVRLWKADAFEDAYHTGVLGPDALQLTSDALRDRLAASRREIKVALLDQRAVAGIGNLYAAEILHVSRIHPQRACQELTPRQWDRLFDAMQDVLLEAIRYEGSTLSDGTYRNALNATGTYQDHHRVYGRAGQPCLSCQRGVVQRIVQAQRATFFCPACQE